MRFVAPLLLAAASVAFAAPLQCARKTGPEMRTEDDPAEVLYGLAETLRYLVSRYPESRFAQAARLDLGPTPSPPGPHEP
jgi:outer membrane protein assembly factor BamD (BamD/ComL family)